VLETETIRLSGGAATTLQPRWTVTPADITDSRAVVDRLSVLTSMLFTPPALPYGPATVAGAVNALLDALLAQKKWLSAEEAFLQELPQYSELEETEEFRDDDVYNMNRQMLDIVCRDGIKSAFDTGFGDIVRNVHEQSKTRRRTALCISGGGIRSATFALGVIQGLAKQRLLGKFDFLSTVSGGGYIGSWLSSWIRRDRFGVRGVEKQLHSTTGAHVDAEPEPIRHLRDYSNYLTPKLGALSADTWTLVCIYIRNVLLNWLVLIPLLVSVLAIPRLMTAVVLTSGPYHDLLKAHSNDLWSRVVPHVRARDLFAKWFGVQIQGSAYLDFKSLLAFAVGLGALILAYIYLLRARPVSEREDQSARHTNGEFLRLCIVPLLISAALMNFAWAWFRTPLSDRDLPPNPTPSIGWFIAFTLLTGLTAWVVFVVRTRNTINLRSLRDAANTTRRMSWELFATVVSSTTAGALFWLCARWIFPDPVSPLAPLEPLMRWPSEQHIGLNAVSEWFVCFGVPLVFYVLYLQAALFVGFASKHNEDYDREWWARASAWVLLTGIVWSVLSLVAIFGPVLLYLMPKTFSSVGGIAGLFALIAGRSDATPAKGGEMSLTDRLFKHALTLAVPLFLLIILSAVSLGTTEVLAKVSDARRIEAVEIRKAAANAARTERQSEERREGKTKVTVTEREKPYVNEAEIRSLVHLNVVHQTDLLQSMAVIVLALLIGLGCSFCIGVNAFSMHSMYRNRLIRAYLGASRARRAPNLFTGFDPQDNLDMHLLRPEMLWTYSFINFDEFAKTLVPPYGQQKSRHEFLWKLLESSTQNALTQFKANGRRRREVRELLFANINALLDIRDLDGDWEDFVSDRRMTLSEKPNPLRSVRNRRFLDDKFADDIFPYPMPLLCANDIIDETELLARLEPFLAARNKEATTANAIELINESIKGSPADLLPIDAKPPTEDDRRPFTREPWAPLHKFIENRLQLDRLFRGIVEPLTPPRPMHVVNAALNLVGGENLGWQERKAETFTFTPSASGSLRLGYRETKDYGEVSLGTAVTISGAAASPNMGYHSNPALALLMMLFNVRLGWWLGNPGVAGNATYRRKHPASSLGPLVNEAVANTNDRYEYVYLSDGGHFDNLGLYEMVLRRCHDIVVSDAGSDEEFNLGDLGNAIRKIRIDLAIPIEITAFGLFPRHAKRDKFGYAALARIKYAAVDGADATEGRLLYIKPAFYEEHRGVPKDVFNYAQQNLKFPHESTADQFFSESQFESYRSLGQFAVDQICGEKADVNGSFDMLFDKAKKHLEPFVEP